MLRLFFFMCATMLVAQNAVAQNLVVTESRAYFHSEPSMFARQNLFVVLGDKVRLLEKNVLWTKVVYEPSNTVGWLQSSNLVEEKLQMIGVKRAYFHELPYENSVSDKFVITGDVVQVLRTFDDWLYIVYTKNNKKTKGWIRQSDIVTLKPLVFHQEEASVYQNLSLEKPKVWAVLVGVSKYSQVQQLRGVNNLQYSDDDAFKMYQFLRSPSGGALPSEQVLLLTDEMATYENILQKSNALFSKAQKQDLIIFYYSGHGGDNTFVGYNKNISHSEVKEVLNASPAKKKLCIADACHSGSFDKTQADKALSNPQMIDAYYNALSASSDGIALFLSSKSSETSSENNDFGQGVFTYYYIQGLKGYADKDYNKIITIQELYDYTRNAVEEYTRNIGSLQRPQLKGTFDHDMPIGITR